MARGRSSSRGTKEWTGVAFVKTTLTQTQSIILSFTHDVTETILRNRGEVLIVGVPNAAADDDVVGLGIIVVNDAAAAVGGLSVPGPIADPNAQWLWHQFILLQAALATSVIDNARNLIERVTIDSKAMRKADRNETMILVGELSTGEFGAVSVNGGLRSLSLFG